MGETILLRVEQKLIQTVFVLLLELLLLLQLLLLHVLITKF